MNGNIAIVEGTRINGQWDWKVYHGTFDSPQGTIKTETVKEVRDLRAPVAARQSGFWEKTANFAGRSLGGAFGAGLSFAAGVAVKQLMNGPQTYSHAQLCEMGMYAAGLGLASAVVTSEAESAFVRGTQFGVVTQVVAGAGFGDGTTYEKAVEKASDGYKFLSEQGAAFGTAISTKASDAWAATSTKASDAWAGVKGFVNSKIVDPACVWSNGGRISSFLGCNAPSGN